MDSLPLGLSVHHFVNSVGAEVGFASLIAVAILVLLYFAQARETATLRARADDAGFRVQELEAQVAELSDQVAALPAEISVSRAPGPRVAPAPSTARAALIPPSAPAGMAAPALAAATRLIPEPDSFVHQPEPEPQPEPAAGGANSGSGANGAGHGPVPAPAAAAATIQRPVRAPVGAPAGSGGVPPRTGVPGQSRVPAPASQGRVPGAAGQARQAGPGQSRPGGPGRPQPMPLRQPPRRSRGRLVLGGLVAALAVGAVVAGVIVLTNSGGSSSASRSAANAALSSQRTRAASTSVVPATVTVSVLNGTDTFGLAGRVAGRLAAAGYRKGHVTNASDQTQTNTVVSYMAPSDRQDALAVASALKLSHSSVQAISPSTKAIACPPPQACTSAVVVTVGRDLVSQ